MSLKFITSLKYMVFFPKHTSHFLKSTETGLKDPVGFHYNDKLAILTIPRGLTARIPGFHPGGPGSTPGVGKLFFPALLVLFD